MESNHASSEVASSSTGSLVLAWLVVGLPLAWGVSQTFIKALALFK
ncbi:MFS transporter small subunit [Hymenobacter sp. 102]